MHTNRKTAAIIVAANLLNLLVIAGTAHATSCGIRQNQDPTEARTRARAVFSGTVDSIVESKSAGQLVTFIVEEAWKGVTRKTVTLKQYSGPSGKQRFKKGGEYLVYAEGYEVKKGEWQFTSDMCSRTLKLEYAMEDLAALGEPAYRPGIK